MSAETAPPGHDVPGAARTRTRRAALAAVVVVTVALAWYVLGTAGGAVLGGAWLLAAACGRLFPRLSGPVSWAVGVLAEAGLVVATSAVAALLAAGPHPALVQAASLAVPVAVGGALLMVGLRRPPAGERLPSRWPVALVITVGALTGFALLAQRGPYYDVAWAMSGDARNHAQIMRMLLGEGGLTVAFLRGAPAAANAIAAVIAGAAGRDVTPGQLLLDDAYALAATYVLAAIAVASLLAAAVLESLPRAIRAARLPAPVTVLALVSATGAVTPLLLGTTLVDGFFSAYVVVAMVMASLVVGLRLAADPGVLPAAVPILILATGLTLATWPLMVVLPAAVLLLALVDGLASRRGGARTRATDGWMIAGALTLVGVAGALALAWPSLRLAFTFTGSIQAPSSWLLPALLLVALAVALDGGHLLSPGDAGCRRALVVPLAAGAAGAASVLLLRMMADAAPLGWSYYGYKMSWLVACSLIWVPLVPLAAWASRPVEAAAARPGRALVRRTSAVGAAAVAVVLGLGNATSAPEPLVAAARGWSSPSAAAVGDAVRAADRGQPFVFWAWAAAGGDDRLANFWAALAWSTDDDGSWVTTPGAERSFPVWAYFADGTTTTVLCELLQGEPDVTVYTREKNLERTVEATCPEVDANVVVGG